VGVSGRGSVETGGPEIHTFLRSSFVIVSAGRAEPGYVRIVSGRMLGALPATLSGGVVEDQHGSACANPV